MGKHFPQILVRSKVLVFTLKSSSVRMNTYVRYVINDAVVPIETCSTGPGFSCEINDFYGYAEKSSRY
nr:ADM_HP1_G0026070.mRNA.1.CDS.1 [Saccharomyces cerevisiae]